MRIGIITGEYPPMRGGVGAMAHILAGHFADAGHTVCVLSSDSATDTRDDITMTTVRGWGPGALRAARAWAAAKRLDVVNIHMQTAAYSMSPWAHFLPDALGVPAVTTLHDLRYPYLFPKAGSLRPWIVRRLARASSHTIVTNHEDAATLQQNGIPATVVPIGSNILPGEGVTLPPKAAPIQLAYFGFMNHTKGVEHLLGATSTLRAAGVDVGVWLVGDRTGTADPTNRVYAEAVEGQIDVLGLADAVRWTGYADDATVTGYLRAADAVVLPFVDGASYRRGTLMAAIACEAVIVSTQPQMPVGAFVHGQNMLLAERESAASIAGCIRQLVDQPALAHHLRMGARALRATFSWKGIAGSYLALMTEATEDTR